MWKFYRIHSYNPIRMSFWMCLEVSFKTIVTVWPSPTSFPCSRCTSAVFSSVEVRPNFAEKGVEASSKLTCLKIECLKIEQRLAWLFMANQPKTPDPSRSRDVVLLLLFPFKLCFSRSFQLFQSLHLHWNSTVEPFKWNHGTEIRNTNRISSSWKKQTLLWEPVLSHLTRRILETRNHDSNPLED